MDMEAVIAVTGLEIAQVAQKGDIKFMDVSGCNITSYFQISDQVAGAHTLSWSSVISLVLFQLSLASCLPFGANALR